MKNKLLYCVVCIVLCLSIVSCAVKSDEDVEYAGDKPKSKLTKDKKKSRLDSSSKTDGATKLDSDKSYKEKDYKQEKDDSYKVRQTDEESYEDTESHEEVTNYDQPDEYERTDSTGKKYYFQVKWDGSAEQFEFSIFDLAKSKSELAEIGEYTGNYWNGWSYFDINTKNEPDYQFVFWSKFYQEMYNKNYNRVDNVYDYFKKVTQTQKISSYGLAVEIMKCIQVIEYERPYNIAPKNSAPNLLDFFTPNQVAYHRKGDCDTKSVFMVILLRRMGYDALLYHSAYYKHVMVGININGSGKYKTYNGSKYYFIESTYPGWRIGDVPPEMSDLDKWRIVPIK